MNLVIDQGNTVCKVAICSPEGVLKSYVLYAWGLDEVRALLARHPQVTSAIYSSVAHVDETLIAWLREHLSCVVVMDAATPVPIQIGYDRSTLGTDRVAAVVGAVYLGGDGHERLVIDAGTAVTYERISASGKYLGGNISLGLSLRSKALHHFTGRLPLVEGALQADEYGHNTQQAIALGVMQGLLYEIDTYIDRLRAEHPTALVFLAGGDAPYIASGLRNKTMIARNLVLGGLNVILEYNKR